MPRIAVITPYYKEDTAVLRQCHESVLAQGVDADHILVADGFPNAAVGGWRARHVILPGAHGDNGNTPRGLGSMLAEAEGYDFIAYLDADNWYHPGHLSSLLQRFRQSAAPVCTSLRTFHLPDGTALPVSDPDENLLEHVDTSCYLIHRWAFGLTTLWSRMPRQVSPICDRIFYSAILKERYALASTRERSVAFRTLYTPHYMAAGLKPPPDAKPPELLEPSYAWLLSKAGVDECFHRLGFWPMTFMRNYPGGPGQKPLR
jgi:glycosyltransferase involved in cell wall biosynthesis